MLVPVAEPVLPPMPVLLVLVAPVLPELVLPEAVADAAPDVPPVADPATMPESPEVTPTDCAPEPPSPLVLALRLPSTSPV